MASKRFLIIGSVVILLGALLVYLPDEVSAETKPGGTLKNDQPARVYTTGWWWSTIPDELTFKVPTKTNHYTAIAVHNRQSGEDFDLFAYNDYDMTQRITSSTKGSNVIDFVVIDGHTYTGAYKYAKVIKFTGQDWTSGIRIESDYHTVAADLFGSDPDADGYLKVGERRYSMFEYHGTSTYDGTLRGDYPLVNMYDVYLDAGGTYDFDLYSVPSGERLSMYLLKGSGNSDDALVSDTSSSSGGSLSFNYQPETSGYYGLCVIDENQGYTSTDNYTVVITSDFSLSANPVSKLIAPGMNASYEISLKSLGVTKDIDLHYRWVDSGGTPIATPAGAVATLGKSKVNTGGVGTEKIYLNVSTSGSFSAGTYYLTVYGNDTGYNGNTRSTKVLLRVSTNPDFFLTGSPALKAISPGSNAVYSLSMETINNYGNNVSLSATVDRGSSNFGFSYSPTQINRSRTSSTLTVTAGSNTPIGIYNISMRGSDGALIRYANVTLRIKEPISIDVISPSLEEIVSGVYTFKVKAGTPDEVKSVKITFGGKMRAAGTLNTYYSISSQTWERSVNTFTFADGLCWLNITAEDYGGGITTFGPRNYTLSNSAPNPIINTPKDRSYVTGTNMPISVNTTSYVISCRFKVDQNAWSPLIRNLNTWTGTYDTTQITDGEHTLTIEAKDSAGLSGESTITIFIDNSKPTSNINSPIDGQYIEGSYTFRVVATDTVGVNHVDINIFGKNITLPYNPITSSYEYTVATSTKPDGIYSVYAVAYDNVNQSKKSEIVIFSIDNNAPSLNIVKPIDEEIIGGNYTLTVTSSDFFLNSVKYRIDSMGWQSFNGVEPTWSKVLNTKNLTDGRHLLTVRSVDNLSHVTEQSIDIIVDNTNPTCNMVSPFTDQFLAGVYTFKVSASDTVGIDKVDLNIFSDTVQTTFNRQTGYYEYQINTLTVPDGIYTVTSFAYDLSGKVTASADIRFRVDNNAPVLNIQFPLDGEFIFGNVTLRVSATDVFLDRVEYDIDGSGWVPINRTLNSSLYGDGDHVISFRAFDKAGHMTQTSSDVIIDNTNPYGAISNPVRDQFLEGIATFTVVASDIVGVDNVKIEIFGEILDMNYNAGSGFYEYKTDTRIIPDGTYEFNVTVTDLSGKMIELGPLRFNIDNHYPSLVVNELVDGDILEGDFAFNASAYDVFLSSVDYEVDATGWIPISQILDTTRYGDGAHVIKVRAVDRSGKTTTFEFDILVDNVAPTCTINSPTEGEFVEGTITIRVTAFDLVKVDYVKIQVYNIEARVPYNANTGYYEYTSNTITWGSGEDGLRNVTATVYDLTGKSFTYGPVNFKVDNRPPTININSPQEGDVVSGLFFFDVENGDVFKKGTEYNIDGASWQPVSIGWNTNLVPDGLHEVTIKASDQAGHVTLETINVYVDNHAPEVSIASPSENEFIDNTYTFRIAAFDQVGVTKVSMKVNNEIRFMSYNTQSGYYEYLIDTRTLVDGTYTINATATDVAGRSVTTPSLQFRIDNEAPDLIVESPVKGQLINGVFIVRAKTLDEFPGIVKYAVDGTTWFDVTTPWNTTKIGDGPHTITVMTQDQAGHRTEFDVDVTVDNTAPAISQATITPGQVLSGVQTIRFYAADSIGIRQVMLKIDNEQQIEIFKGESGLYYEYLIDTRIYGDGDHTITVTAWDRAGNSDGSTYGIKFDNTGPEISLDYYWIEKDQEVRIGEVKKGMSVVFQATVTDRYSNVSVVMINIDSTGWREMTPDSNSSNPNTYVLFWPTSGAEGGAHVFQIRTADKLGNEATISGLINVKEYEKKTNFLESFTDALPVLWFILFIILLIAIFVLGYLGVLTKWARGEGRKKREPKETAEEEEGPRQDRRRDAPKEKPKRENPFRRKSKTDEPVEDWDKQVEND
ncbi:MAG: Ig-like domain-containing protein [Thermoplasmatota archaeon]